MSTATPGSPGLQNRTGPTGSPGHYDHTSGPPGLHTKSPQDGSPGVAPPTRITTAPPVVGPTGEPGIHILTVQVFVFICHVRYHNIKHVLFKVSGTHRHLLMMNYPESCVSRASLSAGVLVVWKLRWCVMDAKIVPMARMRSAVVKHTIWHDWRIQISS